MAQTRKTPEVATSAGTRMDIEGSQQSMTMIVDLCPVFSECPVWSVIS